MRSEFVLLRKIIGKFTESPIFLHDFVLIYLAWFLVSLFLESPLVLRGLLQSDILDDHSETAYMNVNV